MFLYSKNIFDEASKPKENNNAHNEEPNGFDTGRCHCRRHLEVQRVHRILNPQIRAHSTRR